MILIISAQNNSVRLEASMIFGSREGKFKINLFPSGDSQMTCRSFCRGRVKNGCLLQDFPVARRLMRQGSDLLLKDCFDVTEKIV